MWLIHNIRSRAKKLIQNLIRNLLQNTYLSININHSKQNILGSPNTAQEQAQHTFSPPRRLHHRHHSTSVDILPMDIPLHGGNDLFSIFHIKPMTRRIGSMPCQLARTEFFLRGALEDLPESVERGGEGFVFDGDNGGEF